MQKRTLREIKGYLAQNHRSRIWKRVVGGLACVAVLGTAYALMRPAIAMEGEPACGVAEHVHTDECYRQVTSLPVRELSCAFAVHQHTAECGDEEGNFVCGLADYAVHEHDGACYDENGALVCPLEELEAHAHEESCWTIPETEPGHVHTDECYEFVRGELTCPVPEEQVHTHAPECYSDVRTEELICGLEESEGHGHGEGCFDENSEVICGLELSEGHTHGDECYGVERSLTCGYHGHTDECYGQERALVCGQDESAAPAEPELVCDKKVVILHGHSEECYETDEDGVEHLICEELEVLEHQHTGECFATVERPVDTETLTYGLEEVHRHGEGCYDENGQLICALEESEGHRHSACCYGTWELVCGVEEHAHGEVCRVMGLIGALPGQQEIEAQMAAFAEAGDEEGSDGYLAGLREQVLEAWAAYDGLTEEDRAKVTNVGRLTELEWLRNATLEEPADVDALPTVTDENGTTASVDMWALPDESTIGEELKTVLFGVESGYAIEQIAYYKITNLTGTTATVTNGGLSAVDATAKVFVYDLGADGAVLQSCAVTDQQKDGDVFSSFTFTHTQDADARVYAFISARPKLVVDWGIYPGTKVRDGYWTAMDGPDEASANVKIDIQLTGSLTALDNHYPFISKVNPGEEFYPDGGAVRRAVGETNDVQCYRIHWVEVKGDGTYNFNTEMELGNGKDSTIQLEYLKEDARLRGVEGGRKLRVFSSKSEDGTNLVEISNSVQNVQLMEENYKGFTFNVTEPCPYVFVSEKVELGYIEALKIDSVIDGSDPFDGNDEPGYDSNKNNNIVRSYDTIQYNLGATFAARQDSVTQKKVNMYFELTLRKSATAAKFDTSKMLWMGENYSVEYLDANGDVLMIMAHDGQYYQPKTENGEVVRDDHGFAQADTNQPVSVNARINGSTKGPNSYKVASGGVAMQRLVGWTELEANEDESVLSGTQSFSAAVQVRNADNEEIFAPAFRMWLEGNESNYGPETTENGTPVPAQPVLENIVDVSKPGNEQYQVKVSAGTNFNVQLKKNGDMSYKNWFDFSTGQAVAEPIRTELERLANLSENHGKSNPAEFVDENGAALSVDKQEKYANCRYGRITCYGITLQLYNDIENKDDLASKGVRGLSLPVGDITFDLNFKSEALSGESSVVGAEEHYTPILWEYNENVPVDHAISDEYVDPGRGKKQLSDGSGLGNSGRRLYWDGEIRSSYAKGGGPSNYRKYHTGCYYGGDWALTGANNIGGGVQTVANPNVVKGDGSGTTYHFKVSDYDFDFDDQHFPTQDAGNSGKIDGYDTYARCFSAGCIQVLSVFPRVQKVSEAEVFLNTTVSNLSLKTRAGQPLEAQPGDTTGYAHEVNQKDNTKRDQIVLYAPGNLTKGSSFNGKYNGNAPDNTSQGFLGTDYWTTAYDCSTFAGDDIWIMGYGMISSGSDYRMKSMNLLQLFDSRALSIRGDEDPDVNQDYDEEFGDEPGEVTFLYAVDPDHPEGYDTNKEGILEYMNSVREEDLVYSSTRPDENGNITVGNVTGKCIGVLMEMRGCNLLGGKYQYMRIPVKVNGDDPDLVSKTVATVNTFRVWSWDLGENMTWANGNWNGTSNDLEEFPKPTGTYGSDGYSGELTNSTEKSPPYYVKTEYQDGHQVEGTHAGGTLAGNSLLILGYKAGINIVVDNKASTGMISYNLGDGESVVDYRLKNIRTEISDPTGQTESPVTELTINTVLDEGYTGNTQRISISGGSYRIRGYAVENGTVAGQETSIAIGTDQNNPTELEFVGSDKKRHRIKVYAQLGANSQSVKFVIQDAPVGLHLPDITFQANFAAVTALNNNDTIKTSAYISGTSDKRAYDQTKGNTDNVTVGVVLRSGTNLTKGVYPRYIELNGVITYDVTYTNSGTDTIGKIYFYDLLPHTEDIRDSEFSGDVVLREFEVPTSDADATIYYSIMAYRPLYDMVKVFGGSMDANGKVSGMNEQAVEDMLKDEKFFKPLAHVEGGKFRYDNAFDVMPTDEKTEVMRKITGLYAKVENLQKGQTVTLQFTLETENNKANDWYKNIANSWIAGSGTLPLTSNKVETQVVSRRISGVVWFDKNLNGIREADEPLLDGVKATLFKKDKDNKYGVCTKDVTNGAISTVTTGENGTYAFEKLAEGDYIVAFSGDALNQYTGATTYQEGGGNRIGTSDGKAIADLGDVGIENDKYAYYIHYGKESASMELHSLDKMGTISLNNGVEEYANQDLGLIVASKLLPKTGGPGTALYTFLGIALMAGAALFSRRRREKSA